MPEGVQISGGRVNLGTVITTASVILSTVFAALFAYVISRTKLEDKQEATTQELTQIEANLHGIEVKLQGINDKLDSLSNRVTRLEESSANVKDAVTDLKRTIGSR